MAENGRQNGRKGDDALILALASGQSVRDAAGAAKIGERTATRRLSDPDFRQRVGQARGAMVARALGRMADGMTQAADTLRRLLGAESESVQLGAARALLELGAKLRESVEMEMRITELERKAKGNSNEHQ